MPGYPGAKPKIGDPGVDRVVHMGRRHKGVTIPEVMELFDVHRDCARRFVLRLVREGKLRRTEVRRRRADIFIQPGCGGIVYRAVGLPWVGWQRSRGQRLSRARSLLRMRRV